MERPYFEFIYREWTLKVFLNYSVIYCPFGCECSPDMIGCPWHWKKIPERIHRENRWLREVLQRRSDDGSLYETCRCKEMGRADDEGRCVTCGGAVTINTRTS